MTSPHCATWTTVCEAPRGPEAGEWTSCGVGSGSPTSMGLRNGLNGTSAGPLRLMNADG